VRYFFSTGEASGELSALALARTIRTFDPDAEFEGIGSRRMRDDGFTLWRDHTGWASMGPFGAIPRIPKLLATMWRTAMHISHKKPDLVMLVDFGAFNLRLATTLRARLRYSGPLLYAFPPAAWTDDQKRAELVSSVAVPMPAFEHQYRFYKSLRLPVVYFGYPLASLYEMRPPRPAPAQDGGTIALLPGSRSGELRFNLPRIVGALRVLHARRPQLRAVFGAATDGGERRLHRIIARERLLGVSVVRGVKAAVTEADAAIVVSGTAVLETTLLGVPCVAMYVISPAQVRIAHKVYSGKYITLPNLILGRELVPELLQDDATPERLADSVEAVLRDPSSQYDAFAELRERVGPPTALDDCARFAVALGRAALV
jgi:lipid-A-disaccharide synthase